MSLLIYKFVFFSRCYRLIDKSFCIRCLFINNSQSILRNRIAMRVLRKNLIVYLMHNVWCKYHFNRLLAFVWNGRLHYDALKLRTNFKRWLNRLESFLLIFCMFLFLFIEHLIIFHFYRFMLLIYVDFMNLFFAFEIVVKRISFCLSFLCLNINSFYLFTFTILQANFRHWKDLLLILLNHCRS